MSSVDDAPGGRRAASTPPAPRRVPRQNGRRPRTGAWRAAGRLDAVHAPGLGLGAVTGMREVLVTNDDGIEADGLRVLAEALAPLGRVTVVAPAAESSATGHGLTLRRPLKLQAVAPGWFSVDGTPADCVNLAAGDLIGRVPDLVASGINDGLNVGDDVTYSGTVAGALEGALLGAPAMAFSLQRDSRMDYDGAARIARRLAEAVLFEGLPRRTLLNVNVPRTMPRGIRVTVQASRRQSFSVTGTGGGRRIESARLAWEPNERSDYEAIRKGWVSVTPLHPDWTNHAARAAVDFLVESAAVEVE